jgi:hypothetical protein
LLDSRRRKRCQPPNLGNLGDTSSSPCGSLGDARPSSSSQRRTQVEVRGDLLHPRVVPKRPSAHRAGRQGLRHDVYKDRVVSRRLENGPSPTARFSTWNGSPPRATRCGRGMNACIHLTPQCLKLPRLGGWHLFFRLGNWCAARTDLKCQRLARPCAADAQIPPARPAVAWVAPRLEANASLPLIDCHNRG